MADIFVVMPGEDGGYSVEPRGVTLGAVIEDRLFIRDGLDGGERVVRAGVPFLDAGQSVRLEETAAPNATVDSEMARRPRSPDWGCSEAAWHSS